MDLGLNGKNVIITGGGSNIGRSIVHAFANEGANIVIAELSSVSITLEESVKFPVPIASVIP